MKDKLIIEGETYIRVKDKKAKDIDRFNIKNEIMLMKALEDLFGATNKSMAIENIGEEDLTHMDSAKVCAIKAKTYRAKIVLSRFIDENDEKVDMGKINFEHKGPTPEYLKSKIATDYVTRAIKIFDAIESASIIFGIKKDYPITMENDDFTVCIAPRVDTE